MAFLGDLLLRLKAETADFQQDLARASASATSSFGKITDSAKYMKVALAGIASSAVVVGLEQMAKGVIDNGDNLYKMSQKIGVSVESLGALEHAAKLSDVSMEGLQTGLKKLSTAMLESAAGGRDQAALFRTLGVESKAAEGALRPTQDVLLDLADKFAAMDDGALKSALAVKLFGKSGLDLIPLLNAGRAGIAEMTDEADRMGLVISTKTGKEMEEFNDNLTRMQAQTQGIKNTFMSSLMPLLLDIERGMLKSATATGSMKNEILGLVKSQSTIEGWAESAATGIAHVVDVFSLLKAIIVEISTPIERLARNIYNIGAIMQISFGTNMSMEERTKAWGDLRYESELYFANLDKRLAENRAPKPLAADRVKGYFDERRRKAGYLNMADMQFSGPDPKLQIDPASLKPKGLTADQEMKMYSSALQSLEKQMFALNHEGAIAVTRYETEKGSLRELLPEHKKALMVKAEALDMLKLETTMRKQLLDQVVAEGAVTQRNKEVVRDYALANRMTNDETRFAISLIGKSAIEQERLNELHRVDLDLRDRIAQIATDSEGQMLPGGDESMVKLMLQAEQQRKIVAADFAQRTAIQRSWVTGAKDAFNEYIDAGTNAALQTKDAFTNAFKGLEDALVQFVKTGKLDFKSLADSIITDIIRIQVRSSMSSVLGSIGGAGGLFGSGPEQLSGPTESSGGILSGITDFIGSFFKAGGGDVSGGRPYIVGEQGPEVFAPGSSGTIIPTGGFGGGGGMVFAPSYTYNIDSRTDQATINAMLRQSEKRTKDDILQSRMRNGVFA